MVPSVNASAERPLLVHHVAKRLGVPPRTVRYWAATGRIPAIKAGPKIWKFQRSDVERVALDVPVRRRAPRRQTAVTSCWKEQ